MTAKSILATALLTASLLVAGCQTPQQKQADQEKKMAMEEQKREQQAAEAAAKQQHDQAVADAKRQQEDAKRMAAEEKAQHEADAKLAAEQKKQDDELAKQEKNAFAAGMIRDEHKVRSVDRFVLAQSAAGARDDAMLNDSHFDAAELNSLGRVKLGLIGHAVPKGSTAPVLVYVNTANAELAQIRMAAVAAFWKDSPYSDLNLQLKSGTNDEVSYPAKDGIKALDRMDKAEDAKAAKRRRRQIRP